MRPRTLALSTPLLALAFSACLRAQATPATGLVPALEKARAARVAGSTLHFYDRLPARANGVVRDPVWSLGEQSAGLAARFLTDAARIEARWVLRSPRLALDHMPATGVSGLDLYVRAPGGSWRWLAQGRPSQAPLNQKLLVDGLAAGVREYMLYLPLYNGVDSVQIGVPSEAQMAKAPPRPPDRARHGACVVEFMYSGD